jgi:hypothetical protein
MIGSKLVISRSLVNCSQIEVTNSCREREEEYDQITFGILWDLATNHPEAGVAKMSLVGYHDIPLKEAGVVRPGQEEVWYKDVVYNVS